MPKILLVGNGAREHIIASKLAASKDITLCIFASAANPGIKKLSQSYQVGDLMNNKEITTFAQKEKIDFAVIGPDEPLGNGVVDALMAAGVPSFGPSKTLAQIEGSKSFARNLLVKHKIQAYPKHKSVSNLEDAKNWLGELASEFVIKPDGYTRGKGVLVQGDHFQTQAEGLQKVSEVLRHDGKVLLEEKLVGEEFSLMTITDGTSFVHLPAVQDHKRAFEGDRGPNTGGMGSYSDANFSLPFLKESDVEVARSVNEAVVQALFEETDLKYKGVLYGGFIAVKDGVKLIEYNARFGDPEAMNVLGVLKSDFAEFCQAVIDEKLGSFKASFEPLATVCKYVVPEGYPDNPLKGKKIDASGVDQSKVEIYYASVDEKPDGVYMTSSRAVAVLAKASTIYEAEAITEQEIDKIKGRVAHRSDIGTKALLEKRVEHIKSIRNI
ncbi:MAG: phosphoribosylamine--glycine ligase [Candidatus Doudnabacteria bacterium]|nr:phosphoribosylamine--glycine ligase [Candidatus Doudnabacteria bacterium]